MITQDVAIINIGLEFLYEELKKQDAPVIHVSWNPPARGNAAVSELLKNLYSK